MNAARIRVRRYKPKGSDLWVVCIHESAMNSVRAEVLTRCREAILLHGDDEIAGFAIVVWDKNSESTADLENFSGHIPSGLIPDYVRNLLLAERLESWAVARVKRLLGLPPDAG